MFNIFNRKNAQEERRQLLIEVLEAQISPSVERRRNGTTDARSLMAQLQAGDQGDSRTAQADAMLARWADMPDAEFVALLSGDVYQTGPKS